MVAGAPFCSQKQVFSQPLRFGEGYTHAVQPRGGRGENFTIVVLRFTEFNFTTCLLMLYLIYPVAVVGRGQFAATTPQISVHVMFMSWCSSVIFTPGLSPEIHQHPHLDDKFVDSNCKEVFSMSISVFFFFFYPRSKVGLLTPKMGFSSESILKILF